MFNTKYRIVKRIIKDRFGNTEYYQIQDKIWGSSWYPKGSPCMTKAEALAMLAEILNPEPKEPTEEIVVMSWNSKKLFNEYLQYAKPIIPIRENYETK